MCTYPRGIGRGEEEGEEAEDGQEKSGAAEEDHEGAGQGGPHVLPHHQHVQHLGQKTFNVNGAVTQHCVCGCGGGGG